MGPVAEFTITDKEIVSGPNQPRRAQAAVVDVGYLRKIRKMATPIIVFQIWYSTLHLHPTPYSSSCFAIYNSRNLCNNLED